MNLGKPLNEGKIGELEPVDAGNAPVEPTPEVVIGVKAPIDIEHIHVSFSVSEKADA